MKDKPQYPVIVILQFDKAKTICARLKMKPQNKLVEGFINFEIRASEAYETNWVVDHFMHASNEGKSSLIGNDWYGFSISVTKDKTQVMQKHDNEPDEIVEYDTGDLYETMRWWGELQNELHWHAKLHQPWNDIQTVLEEGDEIPSIIYWDPIAKKIITSKETLADFGIEPNRSVL